MPQKRVLDNSHVKVTLVNGWAQTLAGLKAERSCFFSIKQLDYELEISIGCPSQLSRIEIESE